MLFRRDLISPQLAQSKKKSGADDPIRTDDLLITSELLYQLSYVGLGSRAGRENSCGLVDSQRAPESAALVQGPDVGRAQRRLMGARARSFDPQGPFRVGWARTTGTGRAGSWDPGLQESRTEDHQNEN